jgi:hypothetical protein
VLPRRALGRQIEKWLGWQRNRGRPRRQWQRRWRRSCGAADQLDRQLIREEWQRQFRHRRRGDERGIRVDARGAAGPGRWPAALLNKSQPPEPECFRGDFQTGTRPRPLDRYGSRNLKRIRFPCRVPNASVAGPPRLLLVHRFLDGCRERRRCHGRPPSSGSSTVVPKKFRRRPSCLLAERSTQPRPEPPC